MRIYLDVCCLNRPFDDQLQSRIRLESEAIVLILLRARAGELLWVSSDVVDYEIGLTPDFSRRRRVARLARTAPERIVFEERDEQRGAALEALGFRSIDALHLACAERAQVEVFFTTDDKLLRLASRHGDQVRLMVKNPLRWILEKTAS